MATERIDIDPPADPLWAAERERDKAHEDLLTAYTDTARLCLRLLQPDAVTGETEVGSG